MSDPIIQSRCADLSQERKIERLERELAEAQATLRDHAEIQNALHDQLAEARGLLTSIRQNFHMTSEWADRIDAFLAEPQEGER